MIFEFAFRIEVFDSDRIGKDKSLGHVNIRPEDLDDSEPKWIPLKSAKSGEILVNAVCLPPGSKAIEFDPNAEYPRITGDGDDDLIDNRKHSAVGNGKGRKVSDIDSHRLHLDLIKAKNLIKTDLIGKSDPYAVVHYDDDIDKTPVAKNTQNPEWNHTSEFPMDPTDMSNVRIEVFDADKLGKDKSLGVTEISPKDLKSSGVPRWYPLQGINFN